MIIDADVRFLRARHLHSVCRRQLLLVVEGAPERQAELVAVDRELDELYRLEPSYPFDDVVRRLALDADEQAILALALAWHVFPELHDDAGVELTVGAALGLLFPGSDRRLMARRLFTDAAPIVRGGLVVLHEPNDARVASLLTEHMVLAPMPWLIDILVDGAPAIPAAIATLAAPLGSAMLPAELTEPLRRTIGVLARRRIAGQIEGLVFVSGDGDAAWEVVSGVARAQARPVLRVPAIGPDMATPRGQAQLRELVALGRFSDAVLFFDDAFDTIASARACRAVLAATASYGPTVVIGSASGDDPGFRAGSERLRRQALASLTADAPTFVERRALWADAAASTGSSAPLEHRHVSALARLFPFGRTEIERALSLADEHPGGPEDRFDALVEVGRSTLGRHVERYSVPMVTNASIDKLVTSAETTRALSEFVDACRARVEVLETWGFDRGIFGAHGVVAMFDGEPGTGKTFAAGIVASLLGLPLYRINVAQLVDKYVGETEKHIEAVFQAARSSHAVLLFDEADALFTKRTSVGSSMDRFANMQTNMLLQQVESYDGIAILTTNLEANLDPAMRRRIHFKVTFQFPESAERAELWRRLMPAGAPLSRDIDFAALGAAFELSGGYIKNAILRACYRAWATGAPVSSALLEETAATECRAAGKLFRTIESRHPQRVRSGRPDGG